MECCFNESVHRPCAMNALRRLQARVEPTVAAEREPTSPPGHRASSDSAAVPTPRVIRRRTNPQGSSARFSENLRTKPRVTGPTQVIINSHDKATGDEL